MNPKEFILKSMNEKNKPNKVKMPAWKSFEPRPSEKAIIAYEIYGKGNSFINMKECILTLHELEKEGKVKSFQKRDTIWWALV